jgi:DsbC/DsbD-like thiol-disulfide interchange protein
MNDYPAIQQFRIWNPEKNDFVYSGGTPMMLSSFFEQTATLHTVHKMPYERSTFLKDNKSKEIFEGDILIVYKLHDGHDKYWKQPNGPAIPTLVTWDEKNLCWEMPCDTYNFEAIGNIHENPKLLK